MNISISSWECLGALAHSRHKVLEEVTVSPIYLNLYILLVLQCDEIVELDRWEIAKDPH